MALSEDPSQAKGCDLPARLTRSELDGVEQVETSLTATSNSPLSQNSAPLDRISQPGATNMHEPAVEEGPEHCLSQSSTREHSIENCDTLHWPSACLEAGSATKQCKDEEYTDAEIRTQEVEVGQDEPRHTADEESQQQEDSGEEECVEEDDSESELSDFVGIEDDEMSDVQGDEQSASDPDFCPESVAGARSRKSKTKSRNKAKLRTVKQGGVDKKSKRGHQLFDINNLMSNDLPNHDQLAFDTPSAYTNENNRKKALSELFASQKGCPVDTTREDFESAFKSFSAGRSIRAVDNTWVLQGMKLGLQHHQLLGAAHMRLKEKGTELPKGGILADSMGLGKTVMTIATIIDGLRESKEASRGTTLIAVPSSSLAKQWSQEIDKFVMTDKTNAAFRRFTAGLYRSSEQIPTKKPLQYFTKFNVIITTHQEVSLSYSARLKEIEGSLTGEKSSASCFHQPCGTAGVLHDIEFHRVVLDEAHAIKNRKTRLALACCDLKADRRWLLSGTPVQDKVEEIYSYFKFLKVPDESSIMKFRRSYLTGDRPDRSALSAKLEQIMLRRSAKTTLLNRPLLDIPKFHPDNEEVELTEQETTWYKNLDERAMSCLRNLDNIIENEGERKKRRLQVILQLRQMRTHPLLVAPMLLNISPHDKDRAMEGLTELLQSLCNKELRKKDKKFFCEKIEKLGRRYNKYIEKLRARERDDEAHQSDEPQAISPGPSRLRKSRKIHGSSKRGSQDDNENMEKLRAPDMKIKRWFSKGRILPLRSSLLRKVEQTFERFQAEKPGCKVVIFSQFVSTLYILEQIFRERGWGAVTFHGSMSTKGRLRNLEKFGKKPEALALLATMQSGGAGLNLTMASRIMILDLWWNEAAHDQAKGRIVRIGQTEETQLVTFNVKDTIDDKILTLQKSKSKDIDSLMGQPQTKASFETLLADMLVKAARESGQTRDDMVQDKNARQLFGLADSTEKRHSKRSRPEVESESESESDSESEPETDNSDTDASSREDGGTHSDSE